MRDSQDSGLSGGGAGNSLDRIDRQLIAALQVDGRRSYTRLASDIGVSESVVRYRMQRMEREGILQIVGIADPLKIGFDLMALVGLRIAPGKLDSALALLRSFSETSYVASLAGSYDAIAEVVCRDTAHFNEVTHTADSRHRWCGLQRLVPHPRDPQDGLRLGRRPRHRTHGRLTSRTSLGQR